MDLTKSKTHIRESRDSEEHPESLPVFIALDETGSMGSIPDKMIRDYLPKLMDSIIDSIGVKHPQILFMGVGDHECDYCPCQVGQFESSTVAINQCLSKIYLEGRGGGSIFKEINNPYETNLNNPFQGEFQTYEFNKELVLYGIDHVKSHFNPEYKVRLIETCCDICAGHDLGIPYNYSIKTCKKNFDSVCK